ncbi:MAG TPA: inorganic phosphate transporter [Salinivirgaceae bacterium]|nr:inorganic phosphate transporter [Salinivirgaceae bacterium]
MLFFVFLSGGLFLGWSLGANDTSNIFGTAVGSRMIKFKTAAIIAAIFVVVGSVVQGISGAETLNKLSSVTTLSGAFMVSLCSALIVYWMTKRALPVSTSQAIVGAIIGWSFYAGINPNYSTMIEIALTWISSPILGMIISAMLYLIIREIVNRSKIHVVMLNLITRYGLIVIGAFGAYSLGANNIANVIGVFIPSAPDLSFNLGFIKISTTDTLLFLGGLSISVGIISYGEHVMNKIGKEIMFLTPEIAFIVVLSQSLVLFIFSSKELSLLLSYVGISIPQVPISSTHAVIGSILGIGLIKKGREVNFRVVKQIVLGWIFTPIVAAIITYIMLFFAQNVFKLNVY